MDNLETPTLVDRINDALKRSVRKLDNGLWQITSKVIEYHKNASRRNSAYMDLTPVEELLTTLDFYKVLAEILNAEITKLETLANNAQTEIEAQDDPQREEYQDEEIYF